MQNLFYVIFQVKEKSGLKAVIENILDNDLIKHAEKMLKACCMEDE